MPFMEQVSVEAPVCIPVTESKRPRATCAGTP